MCKLFACDEPLPISASRVVRKVYPRDHPEPKFLDQSNHPLAAAAEEPFLTTGAKSLFPLGLLGITSCLPVSRTYKERLQPLHAQRAPYSNPSTTFDSILICFSVPASGVQCD
jgi:hypothetical protein